jgi:hypothetical protein
LHVAGDGTRSAIFTSGNVGIGTTTPSSLFAVGSTSQFQVNSSGAVAAATGITSSGTISFTQLTTGTGNAICLDASNNLVTCTVGTGGVSGTGTTNYIPIFTSGSALGNSGIYQTNGFVGIGTTVPTVRLQVSGDNTNSAVFTNGNVGIETTAPSSLFAVGSTAQFQVNSSGAIAAATGITSSGTYNLSSLGTGLVKSTSGILSVGAAGTDYQAPLSFSNGLTLSSNTVTLGGALTANTTISDAGFNLYFAGSTGKLGVGTTAPGAKLHVLGNGTYSALFTSQ